ncbi:MAG: hypothetical protein SOR93_09785 [Clostridiales Family XIII bacterium]|nr:hypothetical protein [Clostridia bacterium]MDY3011523.1 hypothetical protein [Clostridiales Family XIII bacterium]
MAFFANTEGSTISERFKLLKEAGELTPGYILKIQAVSRGKNWLPS